MRDKAAKARGKAARAGAIVAGRSMGEARARRAKKPRGEKRKAELAADSKPELAGPVAGAQQTSSAAPQRVERGLAPPMPVPIATFNV